MRPALRTAIWLSALALCSLATADGFSIKRMPKVGDKINYSMTVDFVANGGTGTIAASLHEEVMSIDKDGNYSVQQTQISATGTYDKEQIDIPARPPITMTYKPSRQLMTIQGDLIDGNSYRVEDLATVLDPGKPVNMGEVWIGEIKEDKALGTRAMKAEYKLIAEEKIADTDTLKITAIAKETDGENPPKHEYTIWISKADGSMIQLVSKWTNAPFPGISSPISASIKITKAAP